MITIIGPNYKTPEGATLINTTSRSDTWSRGLSPFFAGPVDLYKSYKAYNVENGWQYSKVFEYYLETDGSVGDRYFNWAQKGWNSIRAVRRPMGRGVKPLYSYWDGEKLPYIEARKKIYIPLYAKAVQKTSAFGRIKKMYEAGENLCLVDFDAHSLEPGTFDYWDLWNNPNIKVGHAYVIAMLLEGVI